MKEKVKSTIVADMTVSENNEVLYQCQRCTNCCRWPGFVKITEDDISRIAAFLGVSEFDFVQRCTRLRQYRDVLTLIDKPNGECFFLDGRDRSLRSLQNCTKMRSNLITLHFQLNLPKPCLLFSNEF